MSERRVCLPSATPRRRLGPRARDGDLTRFFNCSWQELTAPPARQTTLSCRFASGCSATWHRQAYLRLPSGYLGLPPTGTATIGHRPHELHPDRIDLRIDLEMTRHTDCPSKTAGGEPLTERRAQAISGIRQHTAEADTGCDHAIDLSQGDLRLGPRRWREWRLGSGVANWLSRFWRSWVIERGDVLI